MSDILKSRTSIKSPYEVHTYETAIKTICDYKGIDVFFWSIDNLIHLTYEPEVLQGNEYILGDVINKYRGEQGITPKEEYFNENNIKKKIEEKKDLFNRGHIFEQVKIDSSYPEYLQNNQNKY